MRDPDQLDEASRLAASRQRDAAAALRACINASARYVPSSSSAHSEGDVAQLLYRRNVTCDMPGARLLVSALTPHALLFIVLRWSR